MSKISSLKTSLLNNEPISNVKINADTSEITERQRQRREVPVPQRSPETNRWQWNKEPRLVA
jgi:hypothetical protein